MNTPKKHDKDGQAVAAAPSASQKTKIQWREGERVFEARSEDGSGVGATVFPPRGGMPEREALEQLLRFGRVKSLSGKSALALAGMSDLHPNHPIPVGAALATPEDFVVPSAIGNDINCGMRMARFEAPRALTEGERESVRRALRSPMVEARRDAPLTGKHFKTLFEDGPEALAALGLPSEGLWRRMDLKAFAQAAAASPALESMKGSSQRMPEALMKDRMIRDPGLGTLGSGNHFFELQDVDERLDRRACHRMGLEQRSDVLYGLIHTGSRDVGQWVGSTHARWAREAWGQAAQSAPEGIFTLEGQAARDYLAAQWAAARYAWLNRMALQEMARQAMEDALGLDISAKAIADCSHNVALREGGRIIHRKGACRACAGETTLIPGSMGDYSFVGVGLGRDDALSSCSHGAGRSKPRGSGARSTGVSKLPFVVETAGGRRVSEEAPWNYMDVEAGAGALADAGLIELAARMRPWATFKA
jgi:tRNA-splicing ligase RtcB